MQYIRFFAIITLMSLSVTPKLIIAAAKSRGWKVTIIDEAYAFYRLDLADGRYFYVGNISTVKSGVVNSTLAKRKDLFHKLAESIGVATPTTLVLEDGDNNATELLNTFGKLVVKPTNQSHGDGITVDITDAGNLERAIDFARTYDKKIIAQQQVEGDDYRLLFIGGRMVASAIRVPAFVVGDGKQTIEDLICAENDSPRRAHGYSEVLTKIDLASAHVYLKDRMHEIPAAGDKVRVMGTANIGRGGVSIDVTNTIDSKLVAIGTKIVNHFGIGLCGIDIIYREGGEPFVIEINTAPSLGLHEYPYEGSSQQTPDAFLDWLTS